MCYQALLSMGRTWEKIRTIKNRILNPPFAASSKCTSKFNLYRNCQTSSAAAENSPGALHPHNPALATQKDTLHDCQVPKALKSCKIFVLQIVIKRHKQKTNKERNDTPGLSISTFFIIQVCTVSSRN